MLDGMGGPSGVMPGGVGRLTEAQVAKWWLEPMAEMRRAAEQRGGSQSPQPGRPAGPLSFDEFKGKFGRFYPNESPAWWEAKYAKWQENSANGTRGDST